MVYQLHLVIIKTIDFFTKFGVHFL